MIAELRQKSQITIPKEIINQLSLSVGDKFDIYVKDGAICLMPVVVYPKSYVEDLKAEIKTVKEKLASNEQQVFDNVEDLFEKLEED